MEQLSRDWFVYKNAKGVEELTSRQLNLSGKLRTLLVMANPQQTVGELLDAVEFMGITLYDFETLFVIGLIGRVINPSRAGFSANAAVAETNANASVSEVPEASELEKFQSAYSIMTELVGKNLGLSGFFLQMKIEKAASLKELAAIAEDVLKAYKKRADPKLFKLVVDQLKALFSMANLQAFAL